MSPSPSPAHTWIIDSLEEDSAQIEEDGVRVIHVPRSILPEAAREGDVLIVTREEHASAGKTPNDAASIQLTITLDQGATRAAKFKSRQQVRRISQVSKKIDPGGDVIL
jgi:hypothetical protein